MMSTEIINYGELAIPTSGIRLNGIDMTSDSISIRLNTSMGPMIGVCDADCCSETWIENIELPALGFPCTVIAVEELQMPEERESQGDEPQEYILFYGLKFITDKGEMIIEYRNASNGYYGGSLEWKSDYFYGGVFVGQEPNGEWISVDDWQQQKAPMVNQELML